MKYDHLNEQMAYDWLYLIIAYSDIIIVFVETIFFSGRYCKRVKPHFNNIKLIIM